MLISMCAHPSIFQSVTFVCKEKADCIANAIKQYMEISDHLENFRKDEASCLICR